MHVSVLDLAVKTLQEELGESFLESFDFRGQITVVLKPDAIQAAASHLRNHPELQFNFLAALTAVDYWPQSPRFHVVYQFLSMSHNVILAVRVPLEPGKPDIDSIDSIFPAANPHEREVFDMFGITFKGSRDLRRILMPWDWEGHPLRKDYPLGEEEVQFSFNFDEVNLRKQFARE